MSDFRLRFWQLDQWERGTWYLDWSTGEQLQAWLESRKQDERKADDPMFKTIEDINGCSLTVRIDYIINLSASTPETRAAAEDPDAAYEQIRRHSIEVSKRKWGSDAEDYEK
jgi:hypothetical protein